MRTTFSEGACGAIIFSWTDEWYRGGEEAWASAGLKADDMQRRVKIFGRDATVDGMYLRIIVHANEHMGQLIAYARMTGVVPPWSGN